MAAAAASAMPSTANLNALADVAANLFISLPDSPQGKPFLDRADAGSPAALLRAMRRRLNLTQREFGILLSPNGASPISPSVICQLESALQTVPSPLVSRAVAATTAAQRLGEYLTGLPAAKASDAAGALKSLGPGCIDELQPYLTAFPDLNPDEGSLVREFLAIVTKRRHSTGGSRPGARGPYRKLSKLSKGQSTPSTNNADVNPDTPTATGAAESEPPEAEAVVAPAVVSAPPTLTLSVPDGASSSRPSSGGRFSPRVTGASEGTAQGAAPETTSGRSTPSCSSACSTPGSSRGESRSRSPTSATGYENSLTVAVHTPGGSMNGEAALSPCLTPGGTVAGFTPTPRDRMAGNKSKASSEVSLEVLMALRRLQEENDTLQQENKRLRSMVPVGEKPLAMATIELTPTEQGGGNKTEELVEATAVVESPPLIEAAAVLDAPATVREHVVREHVVREHVVREQPMAEAVAEAMAQAMAAEPSVMLTPRAEVPTVDLPRADVGMSC
eukprot:CAMPEP_0174755090 /NCGR_PEP_ID=MMETSP1094-20130205/106069_1 /TAXON_ID=156173 /ORGANISM="Chrysochromulina brevifilum, Strain UTEX LB 985" /LENGTH=503 /DNA_ID=CAMNT_0015960977 /DNA_START=15 /DNA_END=1526 /DNA_ORIENTATION=-